MSVRMRPVMTQRPGRHEMVQTSLKNSSGRSPRSPRRRSDFDLLANEDSEPELATEADVREAVVRTRSEPEDRVEADRNRAHLFGRPLPRCPTCGSDQLEPVVEKATQDVLFLCQNCGLYWRVELGFVHRVRPSACLGGHA
jgi:hypothetical protein